MYLKNTLLNQISLVKLQFLKRTLALTSVDETTIVEKLCRCMQKFEKSYLIQ